DDGEPLLVEGVDDVGEARRRPATQRVSRTGVHASVGARRWPAGPQRAQLALVFVADGQLEVLAAGLDAELLEQTEAAPDLMPSIGVGKEPAGGRRWGQRIVKPRAVRGAELLH